MPLRFQDKIVVVTGGARGIGRAAAERFACEGAHVAVVDLAGPELDDCVAALTKTGAQAIAIAADVCVRTDVEGYIADIATYPWIARNEWHQVDLNEFPNVKRWYEQIGARPAVQRGMNIPKR